MIGLRLNSSSIFVSAGGTGAIEAVVVNDGSTVDEMLSTSSAAAAWSTVTPPTVRLFPGDRSSVTVRFQAVLGPQLASGEHHCLRACPLPTSSSVVTKAPVSRRRSDDVDFARNDGLQCGRARQRLQIAQRRQQPDHV
jgi:hypothetical protein